MLEGVVSRRLTLCPLLRNNFYCISTSCRKSFENTVGKGEIARYEQFLLSHDVFYPFREFSSIFMKFVWKSLRFVVWERVKGNEMSQVFRTMSDCADSLCFTYICPSFFP